ncbi:MAG: FAD-dependent oxidoreductase [Pseudomonadota bacterium]
MPRSHDIVIAGAGIAGLSTALALARQGIPVRIFERREAAATDTGAGLQLSPNAMQVMHALGINDDIEAHAAEPREIAVRDAYFGAQVAQLPLGAAARQRYGAPYLTIDRPTLRRILLTRCQALGVSMVFGTPVRAYNDSGSPIDIELADNGGTQASALVIADGVHSALTVSLGGADPEFSGFVAWRALVDNGGSRDHSGTRTQLWVGRGAHIVTYPVASGRLLNVLACAREAHWPHRRWSEPADPHDLAHRFRRWHREVRSVLQRCRSVYKWGLHVRDPLARWSRGPVIAIGDACHPMLPFAAQGAAQAIEDAWAVATALARHADPSAAFSAVDSARRDRVSDVVAESRARAELYHGGVLGQLARPALATRIGGIDSSMDWLYGYRVTAEDGL